MEVHAVRSAAEPGGREREVAGKALVRRAVEDLDGSPIPAEAAEALLAVQPLGLGARAGPEAVERERIAGLFGFPARTR